MCTLAIRPLLTHHAHGHGGWIAADVGSRFPVARSVDDGASATGV
jgi:hypothetical protein